MRMLIVMVCCLLGLWDSAIAQGWNTQFDHVGARDGLPEGHVYQILQDSLGFIWMASYEGLFRLDGQSVEAMGIRTDESSGLSNNRARCLALEGSEALWVGTSRGLNRLDLRTHQTTFIPLDTALAGGIEDPLIQTLFMDGDWLWVSSSKAVFRIPLHGHGTVRGVATPALVTRIIKLPDGQICLLMSGALWMLDPTAEIWSLLPRDWAAGHPGLTALAISPDRSNQFWIGTNRGPGRLTERGQVDMPDLPEELQRPAGVLLEDERGALWIEIDGGLAEWDREGGEVRLHLASLAHAERLRSPSVHTIFQDRSGNIWFGNHLGADRINPSRIRFHLFQFFPDAPYEAEENHVQRLAEAPDGRLFFFSRRGVYWMKDWDERIHEVEGQPYPFFLEGFLPLPDGRMLMGWSAPGQGVWQWDARSNRIRPWPDSPLPTGTQVFQMAFDIADSTRMWISTSRGLCSFDLQAKTTDWFEPPGGGIKGSVPVRRFHQTSDRNIWMDANGVFTMLNPGKGTWQVWKQGAELASASRGSRIRDVIAGRGDTLWLAYEDGLYRFTRSDGQFQHYHTGNGLKGGNLVYALQMDAAGNIWFNTFNQIIRLHPATETFTYFSEIHGVYTTFNRLCAITFSDGTMGFGGANGLIRFDPREIRPARRFPPVVLRSVRVGNRSLAMEENVEFLKDLQVDYQDNGFTFEVVALEFTGEHYQSFAWKLEGFDGDWIEAGPVGRITYTNLPPGAYTLLVKAANGDGQWSTRAQLTIPIRIFPPYWEMAWFRMLMALIAVGLISYLVMKTRQIQRLREEKRLADRTAGYRSKFLTNMSHEIRTPMNAILGLNHLLLDTDLQPRQREYVETIRQSADNLMWIINDVLDQARIESGQYSFVRRDFNLDQQLDLLRRMFGFKAEEKGLTFVITRDPQIPHYLIGDPVRLMQVLINLTGNALKFTDQGSIRIRASLQAGHTMDHRVRFEVSDTGSGIDPEDQVAIFDSFHQIGDDAEVVRTGTGLGLSIARELVEQQDGRIGVESRKNHGSTFWFELEFDTGAPPETGQKQAHEELPSGLHILLVEDMPFNQMLAVEVLRKYLPDVQVEVAENGAVALTRLESSAFDLVLMDVKMPVMDGLEATRAIRALENGTGRHVPILGLTANAITEQQEECRLAGMDDMLTKPLQPEELIAAIARLLINLRAPE
ncbi:MAG: ATP-binding protein [Saprospiraceae bacterium]